MTMQTIQTGARAVFLAAAASATLVACGGGDTTTVQPTGTLRVALTDAPACGFDQVNVTVQRVRIHQSAGANDNDSGWTDITLSPARRIDLLTLTNGVIAELGQTTLPAGNYTQIRLVLSSATGANSVSPTNGVEMPLDTPSAAQSGLKLINAFTVEAGKTTDILLDFDACRSVVQRGNGTYSLKPVIWVIPRTGTSIAGFVDPSAIGVTVSAQKDGVVLRATQPNANGQFLLAPVDPTKAPYDVVFTAAGLTTSVITAVPGSASATTSVSTSAAPVQMPASASGDASGKALPIAVTATVRALQSVGGVPAVEVAHVNTDATGFYSLSLPIAPPKLAIYSTTLPLTFNPQSGNAAKYTLEASASGYGTQSKPVITVGAVPLLSNDFTLVPGP